MGVLRAVEEGVAVGRGAGDVLGADGPAGAGPVLHHDGLAELLETLASALVEPLSN